MRAYGILVSAVLTGTGCAGDPLCQDAAIIQLLPQPPGQFANCRVNIFPATVTGVSPPGPTPSYEFMNPPLHGWNERCPFLDIVPPSDRHIDCSTIQGPTPTSCFADSGCFSLTFWDQAGTALRRALGTEKFDVYLYCDQRIVGARVYDATAPSEAVYCRSPKTGGIE
jgi:hypothetical protein